MIKSITKYVMSAFVLLWLFWCVCRWQLPKSEIWEAWRLNTSFPYADKDRLKECEDTWNPDCRTTDLWDLTSLKEDEKYEWSSETIIRRLLWVFGLDTSKGKDLKFIDYARAILNMTLGLLAFIALIMTIYTFYMILFSDNEAWIKKAKWNLVGIFIALGIIWLAWLIISFIFWWYQSNWKYKETNIQTWDISQVWEFFYE